MKTKSKTSKYKYGDKVLVAVGVNDPDFSIDIGGWSGEIDEIDLVWSKNSSVPRYQHVSTYGRCHNPFVSCLNGDVQLAY